MRAFLRWVGRSLGRLRARLAARYDALAGQAIQWTLRRPDQLRALFAVGRRHCPVVMLGSNWVLLRHRDVVEVLTRHQDFGTAELNAGRLASGAFVLGMDDSQVYRHEKTALVRVCRDDRFLEALRVLTREEARAAVAAGRQVGTLDVAGDLCERVSARLVQRLYFGRPHGPLEDLARSLRELGIPLVASRPSASILARARTAASFVTTVIEQEIERRVEESGPVGPDLLGQLVAGGASPDFLTRNLAGLGAAACATVAKAGTHMIDQLLEMPDAMVLARRAVRTQNRLALLHLAFEAQRFHPMLPFLKRYCLRDTQIGRGQDAYLIKAGTTVSVGVMSAMFDPETFADPSRFRIDRRLDDYLVFGHGLHACLGRQMVEMQLPIMVEELLRDGPVRRASGRRGEIVYQGPATTHMWVEFVDDEQEGE